MSEKEREYAIDWRIEGTWICKAKSAEEAQDKFDKAWEAWRIQRDGEASNDKPEPTGKAKKEAGK